MSQPINLITGTPGAGKSLYTMQEVENLHKETGRAVYYYNIPEVTLDHWTEIEDPEKWYELPKGSIIIMDEAQQVFRQRTKEPVPLKVQNFETIRHLGMSCYLITQHPKSIDVELRRRIGRHVHLHRIMGWERSRKFEWPEVQEDPRDSRSVHKAIASEFNFPKDVYTWYKSADQHTIKKTVPWKKLAPLVALPVIIVLLAIYAMSALTGGVEKEAEQPTAQAPVNVQTARASHEDIKLQDEAAWLNQFTERAEGNPHSAKFYDPVLKPETLPKIKGCGEIRGKGFYKCWCNTQQGTIITSISTKECRHYLKFGWFDPTQPDREEKDEKREEQQPSTIQQPTLMEVGASG